MRTYFAKNGTAFAACLLLIAVLLFRQPRDAGAAAPAVPAALFAGYELVDLSVPVDENLPAHWGSGPPMQRWTYNWFKHLSRAAGSADVGSDGPYYAQRYVMDEHTGTHTDFPPHFIPPPGSGLPNQGSAGLLTGDKYPLDRMMGPAVVIDVTSLLDKAPNGRSPVIELAVIQEWERKNGEIRAGDIVLFRTGYIDKYYKPFPAGMRVTLEPVVLKSKPGWATPSVEVMEYLQKKSIFHMGTDGASMGPSEGGQAVHVAGLKYGMSWEEMLMGVGKLPVRGSYYLALPLRIAGASGSPVRAVAFVPRKKP